MIEEKEGKRKTLFGNRFFVILPAVIILIFLLIIIFYSQGSSKIRLSSVCGDGTSSGNCSERNPYFCDDGKLIEKANFCGCPNSLVQEGDSCISDYATKPKNISLNYILNGKRKKLDFIVYKGVVDYISGLPKTIHYEGGKQATRQDFKLRNINEPVQREFLLPLVVEIENLANKKEDQARIAISLVQEIPYGASDKTVSIGGISSPVEYSRYPYEVLYDEKGICGEKSELLSFLLKEIGFDTAIFYYKLENHEAVGIKCPTEYSVEEGGYCFVETSEVSLISNNQLTYTNGVKLFSEPELILISEGNSLEGDLEEYEDTIKLLEIEKKIEEKGRINFLENLRFEKIKKKYGLDEVYNI